MMTFKQFYLQSSKGDKAPPRALRSSKNFAAAERDFGSDREAQGSQVWVWRRLMSTSRCERECPEFSTTTTSMAEDQASGVV